MAILNFNFPREQASEATPVVPTSVGYGDNIKVQAQAFGDARLAQTSTEAVGNVAPATLYNSTAPHVEKVKDRRAGRCVANDGTCNGFATKRWPGLCAAHGMSQDRDT